MAISAEEFFKRIDSIVSTKIEDVREQINTVMDNQIKITNTAIKHELEKLLQYKNTMDKAAVESSAILSGLSTQELEELITLSGSSKLRGVGKELSGTFGQAGRAIQNLKEEIVSEETFRARGLTFSPEKAKKYRDYLNYIQLGHNNSAATKKLEAVVAELYILKSELIGTASPQIISALDGIIKVNRLALIASSAVDKGQQNRVGSDASTSNIAKFFSKISSYASPAKTKVFEEKYKDTYISITQLKNTKKGEKVGMAVSLSVENAFDNYAKAIYSQKINELTSAMSLEIAALFGSSTTTRTKLIKTIQSNKLYKTVLSKLKQAEKSAIIDIEKIMIRTDVADIRSSPTLYEMVEELWVESIRSGNDKGQKTKKNIKKSSGVSATTQSKKSFLQDQKQIDATLSKLASDAVRNTKRIPTISRLRNQAGRFVSLTSLEVLIRAALPPVLLKNMKRPNLMNQTSRFRDSVELKSLTRQRDGSLIAFLGYMKYPYATFEKSGKQGRKGYYPSRLIDQSVREIASKLVTERLRVAIA